MFVRPERPLPEFSPETAHEPGKAPRISPLGDAALTIVFGDTIDAAISARVRGFCAALVDANRPDGLEEWAPAFASATLWYDPEKISFAALADFCAPLAQGAAPLWQAGALFELPVCRDVDLAPDLEEVARLHGMTPDAYVEAFSALTFDVFMLGFLPGFAYLGGLPETLSAPRLDTPRKIVPARSVAIADGMCAAYPSSSPGGWRLIGRTPAPLFDAHTLSRPSLLAPGDRVIWREIGRGEFDRLERQWAQGDFCPELLEKE
jgi:KipI family sensor histidine kinase inhibitor